MKRCVSVFFFLFAVFPAKGQHGNEWINFGQRYFKIPVAEEGLYRISYQDLQEAGVSLSADPRTFQLFHRGTEQAILVEGEADGVFNSGDYIEFFGRGNDGTLDSTLYANPRHQPHRYYNLYSDTTAYFLTYGSVTGKRMSAYSGSPEGLSRETHHQNEKMMILRESYSGGIDYGDVQQTTFDEGEGWMGIRIVQGQEVVYPVTDVTGGAVASGKPRIEILLTGRGPMTHYVDLSAGSRFLSAISFAGYQSYTHAQQIEWSDISTDGTLELRIKVAGATGADRVSAGYIRLVYPQEISMAGVSQKTFSLEANPASLAYIQVQQATEATRLFDVTNPAEVIKIGAAFSSALDAVVPASSPRKIFAVSGVKTTDTITPVSFRNINAAQHNYLIITHPSLRKPALGYVDPVKAYAEYRAFPEGGGFDTLIVNIDQLFDQFNYGERSPRAVFQFLKFMASVKAPDYLFLIGKGLDVNYGFGRNPAAFPLYNDLVPTAGYPASDMAFTAGLSAAPNVPAVATGRLTAMRPEQVAAYLNKVKERDVLPFDDLRGKKILHLSGGIEEHEPARFRAIMQDYATVAEGHYLGGKVQAIAKQSTDIKLINVAEQVNNGLGLVTFFGHSAPNTTDFDIGMVTDPVMGYDNRGKYPFLLMNGCDAGSFFLNTTILGEDWIQAPEKGAIGFIAHSSYGRLTALQRYAALFYQVAFGDSVFIKKSIGEVQREAARRYLENFGASATSITQTQQMVLLGDPAVKLFGAEKPDYAIDKQGISITSFDGEPVTAYSDSFLISIPIRNTGIANEKRIRLEVVRQFNEQPVTAYDTIIDGVLYSDTISVLIRQKGHEAFGINVFSISVDADQFVTELDEGNNTARFEYFIPLNSTRNLYPYNYGIVKNPWVDLSFQYTDLRDDAREYLIELDTTNTFDSGFKKSFRVAATVLARQRVELSDLDTLVYYWRTKIAEPLETESKEWTVSSFTYIVDGPEGWAQAHFPQFERNPAYGLVKDPGMRIVHYQETISDLAIRTFSTASGNPLDSVSVKINGVQFNLVNQGGACRDNTINLIAFDRRSTQPYAGLYFKWYELLYEYGGRRLLCGREPYVINSFTPAELITGNQDDLTQYIDNIAEGDSVVLFNMGDAGFAQWPEQARVELAALGVSLTQLEVLANGDAVIILGRKGAPPGSADIYHATAPETALAINRTIAGRFTSGTMSTPLIGPAQRWERLVVQYNEVEAQDEVAFSIIGINPEGVIDTLRADITADEDLSLLDADAYPYLRVIFHTADNINLTSPQLEKWLVLYEPVADGLVFYRGAHSQQMVSEGQVFSGDFGFVNVSEKSFADSLIVRYDLLNHVQGTPAPSTVRIKAPPPGDTTLFVIPFETESREGVNDVEVFVNPKVEREKSYDNNIMVLPGHLVVLADEFKPVIDVVFDGRHITNNEFVSADPEIVIRIWDENPFMFMKDTLGINIFMAYPCDTEACSFQRIALSREDVTWEPATETSDFLIRFLPRALAEGDYTLRVEAGDASGNSAGEDPYFIRFRVKHMPSVVVTAAYPNPFYFETSFDVTVTGEETTCYFDLEIMTPGGMVVTRFSNRGTGFHVGRNTITWNGNDSEGKSLPDGIYLYRLHTKGSDVEGVYYGKLVLLR